MTLSPKVLMIQHYSSHSPLWLITEMLQHSPCLSPLSCNWLLTYLLKICRVGVLLKHPSVLFAKAFDAEDGGKRFWAWRIEACRAEWDLKAQSFGHASFSSHLPLQPICLQCSSVAGCPRPFSLANGALVLHLVPFGPALSLRHPLSQAFGCMGQIATSQWGGRQKQWRSRQTAGLFLNNFEICYWLQFLNFSISIT